MLVLTRRPREVVYLDFSAMADADLMALRSSPPVSVTVVEVRGDKVRLGFVAPAALQVHRKEIFDDKKTAVSKRPPSPNR